MTQAVSCVKNKAKSRKSAGGGSSSGGSSGSGGVDYDDEIKTVGQALKEKLYGSSVAAQI